jgi:acetyl-CoA C-acetyltransferase
MASGLFIRQEHIASLVAEEVGLTLNNTPAIRVEGGDAAGGLALAQGFSAVAAGIYDVVVVGGAEKMSDLPGASIVETIASSIDQEWECFFGATQPSLWAMMARRHMHDYGTKREQIAKIAVKNHNNGSLNPKAQFPFKVTLENVLSAPPVCEPLTTLEAAPISDGAAAVVLCSLEKAREYTSEPVVIKGVGLATDSLALHDRMSLTTCKVTSVAAERALNMAGVNIKDIDVAEVHDSFTISELMAMEDLGFVEKGKGGEAVDDGITKLGGDIPINTSGGLKARGNPLGATGIAQAVEIYHQLKGKADSRQVADARFGLTHNMGGSGGTAVIHVMEAV